MNYKNQFFLILQFKKFIKLLNNLFCYLNYLMRLRTECECLVPKENDGALRTWLRIYRPCQENSNKYFFHAL